MSEILPKMCIRFLTLLCFYAISLMLFFPLSFTLFLFFILFNNISCIWFFCHFVHVQLLKRKSKIATENYKQNNFCTLQNTLEMASEANNPLTEKSSLPLHDTIETIPTPNKLTMETTSTAESPKRYARILVLIAFCTILNTWNFFTFF